MFHNSKAVVALSKEKNETGFQKTLGLNDFYFGGNDYEFPVGNIQMVGKSNAEAMKGEEPHLTQLAPHWWLSDVSDHAVDFWLTTEDLPRADNRVTLDGDGNVHLAYTATNDEEADRLYGELKKILNHVGMAATMYWTRTSTWRSTFRWPGGASVGHLSLRGRPADSVLDPNCKAHELDNLYVVDTSFFPSIGAVNPGLTAMANAIRVGEHLIERFARTERRRSHRGRGRRASGLRGRTVQGIALVTFPAASTIFTSPAHYGLSNTQYGSFLPQAVTAYVIAPGCRPGPEVRPQARPPGRPARLPGVDGPARHEPVRQARSHCLRPAPAATATLGLGFGLTVPALNTFTAAFYPDGIDRAILMLNALLGVGTALAPVFVAVFVGVGFWWGLPIMSAVLLAAPLAVSVRMPSTPRARRQHQGGRGTDRRSISLGVSGSSRLSPSFTGSARP